MSMQKGPYGSPPPLAIPNSTAQTDLFWAAVFQIEVDYLKKKVRSLKVPYARFGDRWMIDTEDLMRAIYGDQDGQQKAS